MKNIKISLAGDLGSGKSTVGKLLAKKYGAEVYSTGTIQRQIALEMGMTTLELNKYSETHPEIDDRIDDGLRALNKAQADVIIDSRMAWHFVPDSFAVYMAADPVVSAERIMNAGRESEPFQSIEEAVASVSARRSSEMQRYRQLYGVNIKDTDNYDYVIDTAFIPPEPVAEHSAAHYEKYMRGEKFSRYEMSARRLLPCLNEGEEPAFFECGGAYFIAGGQEKIASALAAGEPLVSCVRVAAKEGAEKNCTAEKLGAWNAQTGAGALLPAFLKA